jgi:phage terminase large subunit-like protein
MSIEPDRRRAVEALEALDSNEIRLALRSLTEAERRVLEGDWPSWAHSGQTPGHDEWKVWVMLAGRGFGKTRAGAEWVSASPGTIRARRSLWSAPIRRRRGR